MNERRGILVLLACIVVLATAAVLMLPAISATKSDLENAGVADVSNTVVQAESEDAASDGANAAEEAAPEPEPEPAPEQAPEPEPEPAPATVSEPEQTPATTDTDQSATVETPDATATPEAGEVAAPETVDPETAAAMPAQNFYDSLKKKDQDGNEYVDLAVYIEAPAGALPAGATMKLDRVKAEDIQASIDKAVKDAKGEKATATIANAVSITFTDADGNLVEPAKKVNVKISASEVLTIDKPVLARVTDEEVEGKAELQQVAKLLKKAQLVNWEDTDKSKGNENTLQAQLKKFGAFAILKVEVQGDEDEESSPADEAAAQDAAQDATEETPEPETTDEGENTVITTPERPAQQFSEQLKDGADNVTLVVNVDAPEGALPEGATMKVEPVTKESVLEAAKDKAAAETEIQANRAQAVAVDITFYDADGEPIEPAADVHVSLSAPSATVAKDELAVVHLPENEAAEVVATTATDPATATAEFDSANFSVYALVYSAITTEVLTADGHTYTITVTFDSDAEIPADAKLKVEEILSGTDAYKDYLKQSAEKLRLTSDNVEFARFFDIQIVDKDSQKIEPKTPVEVKIEYTDKMDLGKGKSLSIVHFADKGTEVIRDIDVSKDKTQVTYMQDAFSVTGTIISGEPSGNDAQHMIIVQDGDRYYIVNNDATLTEVGYDSSTTPATVVVTDPMLWTFETAGSNRHIYFNSEATGFGTSLIASDYYRRYLDPSSANAWTQEQSNDSSQTNSYVKVTPKVEYDWAGNPLTDENGYFSSEGERIQSNQIVNPGNRLGPLNATNLTINNGTISHDGQYLAIERDAAGTPVRLVGGETDSSKAAHFIYADASRVPSGLHSVHAVNHIDISIAGTAQVKIPLAYGKYYDADGNVVLNVTENTKVTLGDDQLVLDEENPDYNPLEITAEDMKRATLTAFDQNGNEINDAFYISGFSQNAITAYSTSQVRIDGRFLVSDLRNTQYSTLNDARYYGGFDYVNNRYYWGPDWDYRNAVNQQRKEHAVEYNVTVVKPVTYFLVNPDNPNQPLYDADGNLMKVTVDVAFSGSFNYWDYGQTAKNSGNECPPVQNNADWRAGDIPNHDMSGMDFKLDGDAENPNSPLVAIEITKVLVDENGNRIDVKVPVTTYFDIYENRTADRHQGIAGLNVDKYEGEPNPDIYNGYEKLHTKSITIDESDNGSALIYDYNATDGMYYISEHSGDDLPKTVVDKNNDEWSYVKTYIETEYIRRGDQYDNYDLYPDPMHVTKDYTPVTDGTDGFKSIPEIGGKFTTLNGVEKKSGFLEFFVYNVYTRGRDVPVEKKWAQGTEIPNGAEVTAELRYYERLIKNADGTDPASIPDWPANKEETYKKVVAGQNGFASDLVTELTLKANADQDKNWKGIFEGLPRTRTDDTGAVFELDYYAVETAVKVPDDGGTMKDVTSQYKAKTEVNSDGTVVITNEGGIVVTVEKKWTPAPSDSNAYSKVQLKRYKKKAPSLVDPRVVKVWDDENDQDGKRPEFLNVTLLANGEATDHVVTLNRGNQWSGKVDGLPEYDENEQPINYAWAESTVEGYTQTASTNGNVTTLTNTHVPETTSATVNVVWDDNNDEAEKRPDNLTVTLSNGQEVVLSSQNNWQVTVSDLPKYHRGQEVAYSWSQPEVADYDLKNVELGVNNTTTITYAPKPVKPPRETVTIRVNTQLYNEDGDQAFWNACGWQTNVHSIKINGNATQIEGGSRNSSSDNRVVSFEVPANADLVFKIDAGGSDVKLNSVISPVAYKSLQQSDNGSRFIKMRVGEDDLDLFAILSRTNAPEIQPGVEPEDNGKSTVFVYVGYSMNVDGTPIEGTNVGTSIEVPHNSTVDFSYNAYAIDQYNSWTANWTLYYWDDESNLDYYHWESASPAQSGSPGQTAISIGEYGKYCILIAGDKRDDYAKANIQLTTQDSTEGANTASAPFMANALSASLQSNRIASLMAIAEDAMGSAVKPEMAAKGEAGNLAHQNAPVQLMAVPGRAAGRTTEPIPPAGYELDVEFDDPPLELVLNATDGWKQSFPVQEKTDENGDPYYYYVVETDYAPTSYTLESDSVEAMTDSGTVTLENKQNDGALKLTKLVKVNNEDPGADAEKALTNGTYKFLVTGNDVTKQVEITFENGVATYKVNGETVSGENGSVVLGGLAPGNYTITETDSGALTLTGIEGGRGDGNVENKSVTVTVTPGDTAAAQTTAQATFTNNIETTSVTVTKEWSDSPAENHNADSVTFVLYQVAVATADNEEDQSIVHEGEYAGEYTNQITGSGSVTIPNLPKTGIYTDTSGGAPVATPVTYVYYVVESSGKAGYIQVISHDTTSEDYSFTITNVAPDDNNKDTSLSITKLWQDENGEDASSAHADDVIVFKLIQTKKASGYVPVTLNLVDARGVTNLTETYYVQKGGSFTLTTTKANTFFSHRVDVRTNRGSGDNRSWSNTSAGSHDFTFSGIDDAFTVSAQLNFDASIIGYDRWGTESTPSDWNWAHSVSGTGLKNTEAEVIEAAKSGQVVGDPTEYPFTMHRNELTGGAEDFTKSATDWVGTVGKLPLLWRIDNDFYAYYYEVTEVSVNGEQVQYSGEPQDGIATGSTSLFDVTVNKNTNTITNKEKPKQFKLNILKVDNTGQGDPVPLPNAKFELQKVKDDEVASSDGEPREFDTNAQGQITMDDLVYGYYRVTEKNPPAGYVLSENPVFYIKVSKTGGVQLLVKGTGKPSTWDVSSTGQQGDVVSFVADPNTPSTIVSSTATVKNEPGKPLPNTGGIGTEIFTIFGIMLVVIAGAVILLGRNRPYLGVPSIAHMRETIGGRR